jgi:hypothetical protein
LQIAAAKERDKALKKKQAQKEATWHKQHQREDERVTRYVHI